MTRILFISGAVCGIAMGLTLLSACGHHAHAGAGAALGDHSLLGPESSAVPAQGHGRRVAESALWHLKHKPKTHRRDCSSLVGSILERTGVRVQGSSRTFWQDAQRDGRVVKSPRPGDLAYFDRTYDANGNGRVDDNLTHVAVVTHVHGDGTVTMVHRGSGQIRILRLSLSHPAKRHAGGKVINDYLRSPSYGGPKDPRLAGQLLHGFSRPPRLNDGKIATRE